MKKYVLWVALAVLIAGVVLGALAIADNRKPEQPAGEQSGSAPDFTVLDAQGNQVKLSDFAGKPVVINFWATWCGYCVQEMPDFDKAAAENPDVVFLMVNATDGVRETVDKAKAFAAEQGYSFDLYFDTQGSATSAYRITAFPTTVFVDANGDVVLQKRGMISYDVLMDGVEMIK